LDARERGSGLSCTVCAAPALPLDGICVFCHAPLDNQDEPIDLLDYLVERIPSAKVKRGHLNRGPISEVVVEVGGFTGARDREGATCQAERIKQAQHETCRHGVEVQQRLGCCPAMQMRYPAAVDRIGQTNIEVEAEGCGDFLGE